MNKNAVMLDCKEIGGHIKAEPREIAFNFDIHWHTYFEIELLLDGEAIHHLNGESKKIGRGTLILIAPTDFHGIEPLSPLKLWNLSFDESLLSERRLTELSSPARTREFLIEESRIPQIVSLFELLREESMLGDGGCSHELCECLLSVVLRQGRENEKNAIEGGSIGRAILYMNIHFRDDPSLGDVAAQVGFHPNYFSEIFKKTTGESFKSYLTSLKTEYARAMLESGFSVTETCHRSGFGSLSNFLSTFKKATGKTPAEYKSNIKKRG